MKAQNALKTYIGTRVVRAEPCEYRGNDPMNHGRIGYLVIESSGEESWVSPESFYSAYSSRDAMTFGLAIEALKIGRRVARAKWIDNGLWIELVRSTNCAAGRAMAAAEPVARSEPRGDQQVVLRAAGNEFISPWLPSQEDMLAKDWAVVD